MKTSTLFVLATLGVGLGLCGTPNYQGWNDGAHLCGDGRDEANNIYECHGGSADLYGACGVKPYGPQMTCKQNSDETVCE
ncbi:uncharacterized protein F4822DRAFT_435008 [Hypoxylon trugodes]|uniref:uncharacterized protein n=1 Tax=Hypoxylon trugodes TaxID=326681 RepID=UPI00219F6F63|nr:uncharacterized protein F4822DRAFT_435008 [Hypoxylon trugodes]KAI1383084.1 hypothetical protein F4822DRAFT_435008 [Hypoxylon trugodes]